MEPIWGYHIGLWSVVMTEELQDLRASPASGCRLGGSLRHETAHMHVYCTATQVWLLLTTLSRCDTLNHNLHQNSDFFQIYSDLINIF